MVQLLTKSTERNGPRAREDDHPDPVGDREEVDEKGNHRTEKGSIN